MVGLLKTNVFTADQDGRVQCEFQLIIIYQLARGAILEFSGILQPSCRLTYDFGLHAHFSGLILFGWACNSENNAFVFQTFCPYSISRN